MRPIVSYDDITLPYEPESSTQSDARIPSPRPPAKKRKRSNAKSKPHRAPGSQLAGGSTSRVDDDDSRELTHGEIWDDSALIDAWNAAEEEYEAYNGPDKGWKKEPVHKSSLWYNVPVPDSELKTEAQTSTQTADLAIEGAETTEEADSQPQNFDSFVPMHDPSLGLPLLPDPGALPGPDYSAHYLPHPPGTMVSQDEAFTRALGAMYWGGYWTAVYHYQRNSSRSRREEEDREGEEQDDDESEDEEAVDEDSFVPTQR